MNFKRSFALLLAVLLAATPLTGCKRSPISTEPSESETQTEPETEIPTEYSDQASYNPLTGRLDFTEIWSGKRPVAIVISNAPKARPQWGLSTPDIVVEGVTEAGITRMMGIYADPNALPERVGPIRSARHDFVEMAQGFGAVFIHAGYSVYAANHFRDSGADHIDGGNYDGTYFLRDADRRREKGMEHSMYLTPENLHKALEYAGMDMSLNPDYKNLLTFTTPDAPILPSGGSCQEVFFSYSGDFENTMKYDASTGLYTRFQNDKQMEDGNNEASITYKNIFLLYLGVSVIESGTLCVDMDLSEGEGVYISNGAYEPIRWYKGSDTSPLRLQKTTGETLTLNIGNSYIGLVPSERQSRTAITPAATSTTESSN